MRRLSIMLLLALPLVILMATAVDWSRAGPNSSLPGMLVTNIFLGYLFGLVPALLIVALHTELTRKRGVRHGKQPALMSGLYGSALGLGAGLLLGLLMSLRVLQLVPHLILAASGWGMLAGLIYGLVAGPAAASDWKSTGAAAKP